MNKQDNQTLQTYKIESADDYYYVFLCSSEDEAKERFYQLADKKGHSNIIKNFVNEDIK